MCSKCEYQSGYESGYNSEEFWDQVTSSYIDGYNDGYEQRQKDELDFRVMERYWPDEVYV